MFANFLDGGGAEPLKRNLPAFDTTSNQYFLLTHLYQLFGSLLGCSQQASTLDGAFPGYQGDASMYEVHKFMALNNAQVSYFNNMVGLAFLSFGGAPNEAAAVVAALNGLFGRACGDFYPLTQYTAPALQPVCTVDGCPISQPPGCDLYANFGAATNDDGTGPKEVPAASPTSCDPAGPTPNLCYNAAGTTAICCASQVGNGSQCLVLPCTFV